MHATELHTLTRLYSLSSCPALRRYSNVSSCPSTAANARDVYRLCVGSGLRKSVRFASRFTRKRLFSCYTVRVSTYAMHSFLVRELTFDCLPQSYGGILFGHGRGETRG